MLFLKIFYFESSLSYFVFASAWAALAALRARSFALRGAFFLRVATCFALLLSSLSLRLPMNISFNLWSSIF